MTGLSNFKLQDILWADAEIEGIEIDYSNLLITITESNNRERKISFKGYIGYSVAGFWDEIVIQNFKIHEQHSFLDKCIKTIEQKYGDNIPPSGDEFRNKKSWLLAEICLSDGASILMAVNSAEIIES